MSKYLITGQCRVDSEEAERESELEDDFTFIRPTSDDWSFSDLCEEVDENLADYLNADDGLGMVKSITPEIALGDNLITVYVKFHIETSEPLSDKDASRLISYCQGQASDGWGEGYEQFDNLVPGVYVSPWFPGQIMTIQECA